MFNKLKGKTFKVKCSESFHFSENKFIKITREFCKQFLFY